MKTFFKRFRIPTALIHLIFWGFSVPIVFTVLNFLVTFIYRMFVTNTFSWSSFRMLTDFAPMDIIITISFFFGLPIFFVLSALFSKAYRKPVRLLQMLFGVEIPIMSFTLARLLFLKSLTPVNILFLSTAAISIAAYTIYIFRKPFQNKILLGLHTLALQAAVVVGVYASILMFFFLPIVIAFIIQFLDSFFRFDIWSNFQYAENLWVIITGILAFFTFSFLFLSLILSPFIGLYMYWRASSRLTKLLAAQVTYVKARTTTWAFSVLYVLFTISLTYQGSLLGFYNQMAQFERATTFENRSIVAGEILKRKNFIENRLVETYLAHYRYLTDSEMTALQQAYQDSVKLDKPTSEQLQKWFLALALPFVYNGAFEEDVKKAGETYEALFDEPIQIAQSKKVRDTLATSFNFSQDALKSSVLDREDQDVKLVKRTITAQPDSNQQFATVTIEEEYENITDREQEVLYVFSLPQDSVMTELQLGADLELGKEQLTVATAVATPQPSSTPAPTTAPNSTTTISTPAPTPPQPVLQKDQGKVAPKGAADQTFEGQYMRRLDPAILEQVGPAQYKLRVYPIPVKEENMAEWQRDRLREPVRNQKVRYSYVTALNPQGQAALPRVTEQRNIFITPQTEMVYRSTIDGAEKLISVTKEADSIAVTNSEGFSCNTQASQYLTANGSTLYLPHVNNPVLKNVGIMFDCQKSFDNVESTLSNKRIAILADSSYSMGVTDWGQYLGKQLPLDTLLKTNTVDLYYFNTLISEPINLNQQRNNPKVWDQIAFGKTDRLKALKQVEGQYDAVLLFTDESEADEPVELTAGFNPAQPIYIIHKDGLAPRLPDSLTTYLQANDAQVVESGHQALERLAVRDVVMRTIQSAAPNNSSSVIVGDLGTWITLSNTTDLNTLGQLAPGQPFQSLSANDPVVKVATHRQVEQKMKQSSTTLHELATLDELNAMAQQGGIVTPYSSFIVLVTREQKELLRQNSLSGNRYNVEYDLGEERLVEPTSGGLLSTSAVPEPHEWALLFVGVGIVAYLGRERLALLVRQYHEF